MSGRTAPARLNLAELQQRARAARGKQAGRRPAKTGWTPARFVDCAAAPAELDPFGEGKPRLTWVLTDGADEAGGLSHIRYSTTMPLNAGAVNEETGEIEYQSNHFKLISQVTGVADLTEADLIAWDYTTDLLIGRACRVNLGTNSRGGPKVLAFAPPQDGDDAALPPADRYRRPADLARLAGTAAPPERGEPLPNPFADAAAPAPAVLDQDAGEDAVDAAERLADEEAETAAPPPRPSAEASAAVEAARSRRAAEAQPDAGEAPQPRRKTAAEIAAEQAARAAGRGFATPRPAGACVVCGGAGVLPSSGTKCPTCAPQD